MKTIIVYSSQTGFTKRYAEWLSEALDAELLTIKEAKKQDAAFFQAYDTIVYGGWCMGGNLVDADWFLEKAKEWSGKKLAMYGVGATPADAPEITQFLEAAVPAEQKERIRAFYCPGGLNYDKMNFFCRTMMKMFAKSMNKKQDMTEYEKQKAQALLTNFDISDRNYIEPIVAYVRS